MDDDRDSAGTAGSASDSGEEMPSLVDDLGVTGLNELVFGKHGKIFSAAGRETPVAEISEECLIMRPPQVPFRQEGPIEDIAMDVDERGILLDELKQPRKIASARFNGNQLWCLGECQPGSRQHYVGWLDQDNGIHRIYCDGEPITVSTALKLRLKTPDGELSMLEDLESE